jgi:hypothetical protein
MSGGTCNQFSGRLLRWGQEDDHLAPLFGRSPFLLLAKSHWDVDLNYLCHTCPPIQLHTAAALLSSPAAAVHRYFLRCARREFETRILAPPG